MCAVWGIVLSIATAVASAQPSAVGMFQELKTPSGQQFKVYVSGAENASRGILLIHGWLGLTNDMEDLTNRFAAAGYRAMAIDLYNGKTAANPKQAENLMHEVIQTEANAKYVSALQALAAPNRKLAVIGWSYGASQAIRASLSAPDLVSATVCYYPFGPMVQEKKLLAPMKSPILIQVGDKDFAFTPEKIHNFKTAVQNAGKVVEIKIYDAKHGFDRKQGKNYNQVASEQADQSTQAFLERNLK